MPSSANDRNLLFGILAQQMDFISRDALINAMHAWVQQKSTPLGQILVDRKALTPDTHALLEALVNKHLEVHGNNPERSLAAISSVDSVKKDLQRLDDPDVQASLAHVVSRQPHSADAPGAVTVSVGAATSKGTRFRILRPHAKGGLGQVYVAEDSELHREVALKEIQEKHADTPQSRARFVMEAEITGGLEHPGIVPVYGLGQYADGRPFYAMRFIKGDSLKEVLEKYYRNRNLGDAAARTLELRGLLGRLVDVCQAIQYAHDRGVLHRDLKPGNIMLGKYGETLVVDWGLAKPMGKSDDAGAESVLQPSSMSGSGQTIAGAAVGTPGYMSPEQAGGRSSEIGTASDVYNLGATLYAILTGQAPAEDSAVAMHRQADIGKVLRKIQAGDIPKPSALNPDIDRALEAICLKAMALKPVDRYKAPRDLAGDLERWLAGEPVGAWPEPWTRKARRWIGKHRTLVTGVAAAVLVGLASLSIATGLLAQANRVITKQNSDIKLEVAEKEKQRKLAESRLRQSLAAVGLFANDARKYCDDALMPGGSRRRLYEVLINQLERQVDQELEEATLDSLHNKLWMYQTLCAVTSDSIHPAKSKLWFDKGMEAFAVWQKLKPDDPTALRFHSSLLHWRGVALDRQGRLIEAKRFYADALAIRQKLADAADAESKAGALTMLADSLDSLERFDHSLKLREQVAGLLNKDRDAVFNARDAWCETLEKAGIQASVYAKRKAHLTQAHALSAELHRERPTNRKVLQRWASVVRALGELEYNHGKLAEKDGKNEDAKRFYAAAQPHYQKLNEVSRKLATSSELVDGVRDYSRSYYTLGLVEELNGNAAAARRDFRTSQEIREQTRRDYGSHPNSVNLEIDLLFSKVATGEFAGAMEKATDLVGVFQDEPVGLYRLACVFALTINAIAEARRPEPLTPTDKRMQVRCQREAIHCLQKAHDGGFSDFFQTSIDADFTAIRNDPAMLEFESGHAYRLGVLAKKRGDTDTAKGHFEKSQALAQQWMTATPKDPRRDHVKLVWLLSHLQLGHTDDAAAQAEVIWSTMPKRSLAVVRVARVYALAFAAANVSAKKQEYREKALAALEQAEPKLSQTLLADDDLDAIREEPRFEKVVQQVIRRQK